MKNKIIISFILLFISFQVFSQVKPFRFGFKLAPNVSWISPGTEQFENNDVYVNDGVNMGISWGLVADFTLSKNYFVKTGVSFDYLGGKLKYSHEEEIDTIIGFRQGSLSRKYNIRYLTIPLTLKLRTNKFGQLAFFGEFGFGTSFRLKAKAKDSFEYKIENEDKNQSWEGDIKDEIAFMYSTLIIGGGAEYFIDESTSVFAVLSFNNGLTDLLTGKNSMYSNIEEKGNLHFFQLSLGVMF